MILFTQVIFHLNALSSSFLMGLLSVILLLLLIIDWNYGVDVAMAYCCCVIIDLVV